MNSFKPLGAHALPVRLPHFRYNAWHVTNNGSSKPTFNKDLIYRAASHLQNIHISCNAGFKAIEPIFGEEQNVVLAARLGAAPSELLAALIDPNAKLFREFHEQLGSLDLSIEHGSGVDDPEAVCILLKYATSLLTTPIGPAVACNIEQLTLRHSGEQFFLLESTCTTTGVPFSSSFLNKLAWNAQEDGAGHTRLITARTEFIAPVFGPFKQHIKREAAAGMKTAYTAFHGILSGQWGATSLPETTPTPLVSNRRSSDSLSASTAPDASVLEPRPTLPEGGGISSIDDEDSDDCEDSNDTPKTDGWKAYDTLSKRLKNHTAEEIREIIDTMWPQWAANRYWLYSPSGSLVSAPDRDEATALLKELCIAELGKSGRTKDQKLDLPKDNLVIGIVECLRLTPPRMLTTASKRRTGPREGGASSTTVLPVAAFCLGWLGESQYYMEEMDAICESLPRMQFRAVKDVHYVVWALRKSRHWTSQLPLLESATVDLLEQTEPEKRRTLRRAAGCAQGLVYLGYEPRELLKSVSAHMEVNGWDWKAAISVGWALAISDSALLDATSPVLTGLLNGIRENAEGAEGQLNRTRVESKLLWQFYLALAQAQPELADEWAKDAGVAHVLGLAKAAWEVKANTVIFTSAFQKDVHGLLCSMGYDAELESIVNGLSVDIAAAPKDGIKLAVEVDGPYHFARNRNDLGMGNLLWKRKILEGWGWTVVNVNVAAWREQPRNRNARRVFLEAAIASAVQRRLAAVEMEGAS